MIRFDDRRAVDLAVEVGVDAWGDGEKRWMGSSGSGKQSDAQLANEPPISPH